jgi:hypothetical protein
VSYLPPEKIADRDETKLASVLLLEQVRRGVFVPHCLETTTCDHFACAAGDLFGDGRTHLVVGNFTAGRDPAMTDAVVVWRNMGPRAEKSSVNKP